MFPIFFITNCSSDWNLTDQYNADDDVLHCRKQFYLFNVRLVNVGGFDAKGVQRLACVLCRSCVLYIRTAAGRGDRGQFLFTYKL